MLLSILAVCSSEELEDTASESSDDDSGHTTAAEGKISERRQQIKNKILAVGRMQRVFQLLRLVQCSTVMISFVPVCGHIG
jgi:serine/threonine-protein phosphatase 2B catalytic subunit